MPNRLEREKSPYLLQHKDNPVDWYPWGDEAFALAQRDDRPIFLSIGYATCHWCHVMERESFEDEDVAQLMNDTFVNIKVDREERPDVDHIYMSVCQMMTGHGGWPLTVIMTPDRKPFFVGTYLPRESQGGRAGMLDLVPSVREAWAEQRETLLSSADDITETLIRSSTGRTQVKPMDQTVLHGAAAQLSRRYDPVHGGFGTAPKFPTPHNLLFLLRYWFRSGDASALQIVEQTLTRMRQGGLFDQVGFGFHRYSTDQFWLLPHFEKMLYDQALMTLAYTDAFQATRKPLLGKTAREIITYVLRDLTSPEGAFYSAEDADSEGEEGKFYVWTEEEIRQALDEEHRSIAIDAFTIHPEGNFLDEATQRKTGANIPHLRDPLEAIAARHGLSEEEASRRLEEARQKLFHVRGRRVRPGLDDKVLTDWNGLMIGAIARAAHVFNDPELASAAEASARFVLDRLRRNDGSLLHRYRDGEAAIEGLLDDYAFLSWGLIELYNATRDTHWLSTSLELTEIMIRDFADADNGGFFMTRDSHQLIVRPKEHLDSAMPSGNSIAMLNLFRLARLTGRQTLEGMAHKVAISASESVRQFPSAYTALMLGVDFAIGPTYEVVVAGQRGASDTEAMLDALRVHYMPNKVVLFKPTGEDEVTEIAPFTAAMDVRAGRATAYVCRDYACEQPVTDVEAMLERLGLVGTG
jgi:uncharacterized protein